MTTGRIAGIVAGVAVLGCVLVVVVKLTAVPKTKVARGHGGGAQAGDLSAMLLLQNLPREPNAEAKIVAL